MRDGDPGNGCSARRRVGLRRRLGRCPLAGCRYASGRDAGRGGHAGGDGAAVQVEVYDIGWRTADQPGPQVALTVAPGTTIDIVNTGQAPHNFDAQDLGIVVDLPTNGSTGQAAIPADAAPGTYDFICNIPGHAPAGMVGTLTIE